MRLKTPLERQIMEAIVEDERSNGATVEAIDNSGVITLLGTAPTDESRAAVIEIAEGQPGVTTVIADIALVEDEQSLAVSAAALRLPNVGQ